MICNTWEPLINASSVVSISLTCAPHTPLLPCESNQRYLSLKGLLPSPVPLRPTTTFRVRNVQEFETPSPVNGDGESTFAPANDPIATIPDAGGRVSTTTTTTKTSTAQLQPETSHPGRQKLKTKDLFDRNKYPLGLLIHSSIHPSIHSKGGGGSFGHDTRVPCNFTRQQK